MTTELHRWRVPAPLLLTKAVEVFHEAGPGWEKARALLYTPNQCIFDWLDHALPLPSATFEARIFCREGELRWLRDPRGDGEGDAVLLSESTMSSVGLELIDTPPIIATLDRRYILWGRGTGSETTGDDGHSTLGTARIGTMAVPLGGVAANRYVGLTAVEYIARETTHGNAYVVEERLTGVEPAELESPPEEDQS